MTQNQHPTGRGGRSHPEPPPCRRAVGPAPGAGRAFTLIEMLTVISIIGLLAALAVGMSAAANRKMKEATLMAERDQLVTAIESYRADFNQYPPDNNVKTDKNYSPAVNPLCYELVGTISSSQGAYYRSADRMQTITTAEITNAFGVGGFLNSAEPPAKPKTYLRNLKEKQRREVKLLSLPGASAIELLAAPVDWPLRSAAQAPLAGLVPTNQLSINPWRYVSSRPTNNPAAFDLWVEAVIGKIVTNLPPTMVPTKIDRRIIIGNWKG